MKKTLIVPESKKSKRVEIDSEIQEQRHTETPAHRRALAKFEEKQQFIYPLERLAKDKLVIRNVKFPGADESYPEDTQALYRFVSKIYPNSPGGPLYVDEPKNETEVYRAYERQKVMKKLGLRHVIVEKNSTYEDLLEQLGEW